MTRDQNIIRVNREYLLSYILLFCKKNSYILLLLT